MGLIARPVPARSPCPCLPQGLTARFPGLRKRGLSGAIPSACCPHCPSWHVAWWLTGVQTHLSSPRLPSPL